MLPSPTNCCTIRVQSLHLRITNSNGSRCKLGNAESASKAVCAPAQELMGEMGAASCQRCRVWAVDLLGQGRSWPQRPPQPHHQLAFSVDTWTEQIADFIRYFPVAVLCARGTANHVRV